MVESAACPYCKRFNREIGAVSQDGVNLRRVNRRSGWPKDLSTVTPAYATPTFILVDRGRELGRFHGYRNPRIFWHNFKVLTGRMR